MKRLRILHVVYCLGTGGTEMTLRRLVTSLDSDKFEHVICSIAPLGHEEHIPGVRIVSCNRGRRPGLLVPQLLRLFLQLRPDLVHSRNWGALEAVIAARLARVPRVIHSEHGRDITSMHRDPLRRRLLRRLCYALADQIFAVSGELRDHYARQLRISPDRIDVIPNGVDSVRFFPSRPLSQLRDRLEVGDDVLVVGTVGRLDPVKDHATLLDATESLLHHGTKLHLVLVGDGPERERLLARVNSSNMLRKRVTFAGEVINPEEWLNLFDVYVLPSLSEGMSNSLLEAMAAGLPCVATRVGSNPVLLQDGISGFLVKAGDSLGMARSIEQLAFSSVLRAKFGEQARIAADTRFSLRSMVERYSRMYAGTRREENSPHVVLDGVKG